MAKTKPAKCKVFYNDTQKNPDAKWLYEMFLSGKFNVHNPPNANYLKTMEEDVVERFAEYNQKALTGHIKNIAADAERIKLQQELDGIDTEDTEENIDCSKQREEVQINAAFSGV